jgi:hypothetical protein
VVLACGAWRDRPLPIEGADAWVGKGDEYKALFHLNDALSFSCRYRDYRDSSWELLESWTRAEITYVEDARRKFVIEAEKSHYNLDQFSRSAGDNGLAILPFDHDVYYQAYLEYGF